jgi:phospholipase B1, membrane-associated
MNLQLIPTFRKSTGPLCPIGPFGWNSEVDQLNAAQSGALASNLHHEVVDYLVPQIKKRNIPKTAFKYLHLQIGSNDICIWCAQSTIGVGPGSPDDFEKNIRKTLEAVRLGIRERYPGSTHFRCRDY